MLMGHLLCLNQMSLVGVVQRDTPQTHMEDDLIGNYDAIATRVNVEIAALVEDATFVDLTEIDERLGLPKGTAFEMGGFADYFAFMEDD